MRSREESSSSGHDDDQQPQPPPLMGGDGSHGPGVAVASTEQPPCHEENVEDETVTLQLQRPSATADDDSNNDNPILCSVVCNRRAIRASSSLIRNLLDNSEDDQELPPFSTEHIANELTLRRVVEFVTDVEPTIPEGHLTDDLSWLFSKQHVDGEVEFIVHTPRSSAFGDEVLHLLHGYVAEDGHRSGILRMLIAAHYLCCEKLKNATAGLLAMVVGSWCSAGVMNSSSLFGPRHPLIDEFPFGSGTDPLSKVSLPVLSEITNLFVESIPAGKPVLGFSRKLFESMAQVERLWKRNKYVTTCHAANPETDDCHICQAIQFRVERNPKELCPLLSRNQSINSYDDRWEHLMKLVVEREAKALLRRGQSDEPPSWLLHGFDLERANSTCVAIVSKMLELDPSATTILPRLSHSSASGTSYRWREFYRKATCTSPSVSIQLATASETEIDVKQLVGLLTSTTKLRKLRIRDDPAIARMTKKHKVPSNLANLFDTTQLQSLVLEAPTTAVLEVLPSSLKSLDVRQVQKVFHVKKILAGLLMPSSPSTTTTTTTSTLQPPTLIALEELVLDDEQSSLEPQLKELGLQEHYRKRNKQLRIFLRHKPNNPKHSLLKHEVIAGFRPEIEFFLLNGSKIQPRKEETEEEQEQKDGDWSRPTITVDCRRFPGCEEEGDPSEVETWEVAPPPKW